MSSQTKTSSFERSSILFRFHDANDLHRVGQARNIYRSANIQGRLRGARGKLWMYPVLENDVLKAYLELGLAMSSQKSD